MGVIALQDNLDQEQAGEIRGLELVALRYVGDHDSIATRGALAAQGKWPGTAPLNNGIWYFALVPDEGLPYLENRDDLDLVYADDRERFAEALLSKNRLPDNVFGRGADPDLRDRVYEALVFVPLLRILNLGTGAFSFSPIVWMIGVYSLLLVSMVLVMRGHDYTFADAGIGELASRRQRAIVAGSVVAGIALGLVQWTMELEANPLDPSPVNAILLVLVMGVMVGFVEELLFRGLLQRWVADVVDVRVAIVVVSLLFGFMHSIWFNPADVVFAFVVSLGLGAVYARSNNFYAIWAVHALINAMAFGVFPLLAELGVVS